MRQRRNAQRNASGLQLGAGHLFLIAVIGCASLWAAAKPVYKVLPKDKIADLKMKPCTLFHVWATWCVPCIEEMPKLLTFLSKHPKVTPIIIDISEPYVQDNFSKKWMKQLGPPFTTYLKPGGANKDYLDAIESPWPFSLPYNALWDEGKRKSRWLGTRSLDRLEADLTRLCR